MSNTIAHLAVAKELLEKKTDLVQNRRAYYLGILASDTITSKPDAIKGDKKRVCLRDSNIGYLVTDKYNHGTIRQKL